MDLSPAVLAATSAAVAVPVFMALMRKVKALQHEPDSYKDLEELTKEYSRWEIGGLFLFLILAPIIAFAIWKLLLLLSELQISQFGESRFLIPPSVWLVSLPAMFLAIFLSAIPMQLIFRALLGETRYAEYMEYGNLKHGINGEKLFRYMSYVFVPVCLCAAFLSVDAYARVTDNSFVTNRFFSVGEVEYPFEKIERLELTKSFQAPNGNIVRNRYYSIHFADGTKYDFHRSVDDLTLEQQAEIINYISNKTTIEISVDDPYAL